MRRLGSSRGNCWNDMSNPQALMFRLPNSPPLVARALIMNSKQQLNWKLTRHMTHCERQFHKAPLFGARVLPITKNRSVILTPTSGIISCILFWRVFLVTADMNISRQGLQTHSTWIAAIRDSCYQFFTFRNVRRFCGLQYLPQNQGTIFRKYWLFFTDRISKHDISRAAIVSHC